MPPRADAQRANKQKELKEKELEKCAFNAEHIEDSGHTQSLVRPANTMKSDAEKKVRKKTSSNDMQNAENMVLHKLLQFHGD